MKTTRITSTLLLLLLVTAGSTSAFADRGHLHGGFRLYIGPPAWSWYYPPPAYYYPPVVTVPARPRVYIEQSPPVAVAPASAYWYYCESPQGYYPYVRQCPDGWLRVAPVPPAP